jgi:SAM-dependent methyltransferase
MFDLFPNEPGETRGSQGRSPIGPDIGRALKGILQRTRQGLHALRPSEIRAARKVAETDQLFDRSHDVETGDSISPRRCGLSLAQRRSGVAYRPIDPEEFMRGFARLEIDHRRFVFVDLGSGKGRALFLASDYPFRAIVGVEFSPVLHKVAQENVRRYRNKDQRCRSFDLHCVDARDFVFPNEPLVLFLYHPFDAAIVTQVARRVRASFLEQPREIIVLYSNPVHAAIWQQEGFDCADQGDLFAIFCARPTQADQDRPRERPGKSSHPHGPTATPLDSPARYSR